MKELIIIGLAVLLVYFAYGTSQTGKNESSIPPVPFRLENRPVGTPEPPPITRRIPEEQYPVILVHESAEQYYAVITEEIIEEEVIP